MCIFVGFDDIVSFLNIFNVANRDLTLTFVWKRLDPNVLLIVDDNIDTIFYSEI
jgi:hypothetical protein